MSPPRPVSVNAIYDPLYNQLLSRVPSHDPLRRVYSGMRNKVSIPSPNIVHTAPVSPHWQPHALRGRSLTPFIYRF